MRKTFVAALAVAALGLTACATAPGTAADLPNEKPAKVEKIAGSQLSKLTLTTQAVKRLDIQTVPVQEREIAPTRPVAGVNGPAVRKVIPYASVLYDSKGATWAYTSTQPQTYIRETITIEYIESDLAVLTARRSTSTCSACSTPSTAPQSSGSCLSTCPAAELCGWPTWRTCVSSRRRT